MTSAQATIDLLRLDPAFMGNVVVWEKFPAQPPRHGQTPDGLDGRLVEALRCHLGVARDAPLLYSHQSHALDAALHGENVVVVSGTASGKTLCYNLAVLHALLCDPTARALYLFPTKALAQDQSSELSTLINHLPPSARPHVRTYDGDTPLSQRGRIRREEASIIITNPDMLHMGILPHHPRWVEMFSNLSYVVLDELHAYRGVFGSHVANVMRRLKRICDFHGSAPQFICTSATIANPKTLSEKLTGEPVALVAEDGAPRAPKHFILYNPPLVDSRLGMRRAYTLETTKVAARFIADDVQTVIFARTRITTELLLGYMRDEAAGQGVDESVIRGYRGGYLPTERREIERGLRTGEVRGVVATNALELGVDIGQMGATVIAGYPGTIASLWQQAGRAGRRSDVSAVVFVASSAPLDQYIALHPRYIFDNSPEHGLINPDNLAILVSHLRCALFELPFPAGGGFGAFDRLEEVLQIMAESGEVHVTANGARWIGEEYPAGEISLRTARTDKVLIQDVSTHDPITIGEVDLETAPLLSHSGAIYVHEGQQYLVDVLNWEAQAAYVRPAQVDYYTRASEATDLTVVAVFETDETGPSRRAHGEVLVTTHPTHFRKIKRYTHEVLGYGEIDLPRREFETTAFWLWVENKTVRRLEKEGLSLSPNDYGPNWQNQREVVRAMADLRCQRCGEPETNSTAMTGMHQHDVHHIRPFREFGYIPDQNENYYEANDVDNLILLCRRCHHRTEATQGTHTALGGLGHALTNLAPLHLMCDPSDISSVIELRGKVTGAPTITMFDCVSGGIGLSERLYELRSELLSGVHDLICHCPCTQGCPACVGPVVENAQRMPSLKNLTIRLADALR